MSSGQVERGAERAIAPAVRASLGAIVAALVGAATTLYFFYPGFMVYDSSYQYQQVLTGQVESSHPPAMVYVWMLTNSLVRGPGGMLALQVAAYWTGLALIGTYLWRSAWQQALLVLGIGLFPPLVAVMATVWKDAGSLAFLLLATGFALHARARGSAPLAWLALLAAFYASAVRTPNLLCVLPLLWLLADLLLPTVRTTLQRAGLVAALTIAFAVPIHLLDTVGVTRLPYRAAVPLWDIMMISLARDQILLPPYAINNPHLDMARLRTIVHDSRCNVSDPLGWGTRVADVTYATLTQEQADDLLWHWWATIRAFPREYVQHRWHVMQLFLTDPMLKVAFFMESVPGLKLDVQAPNRPGFAELKRALRWMSKYTRLYSPWVYLVLTGAVLSTTFLTDGVRIDEARAIALSAILYVAPLPVIAPSTDFRYAIWLVAGSLLASVLLLKSAFEPRDAPFEGGAR